MAMLSLLALSAMVLGDRLPALARVQAAQLIGPFVKLTVRPVAPDKRRLLNWATAP